MKKPGSQRTIQRPSAKISRWTEPLVQRIRRLVWHPILHALLIAAVGAWAAFWWAARVKGPLHGVLQSKAVELLFGAVIAGIVKILLDSVQRAREERSHQAEFVTRVLADLKSAYDKVERARILISAHRSAPTYDSQMQALIEARIQLKNVIRALDSGTSGITVFRLSRIRQAVQMMDRYLESLTDEFEARYPHVRDDDKSSLSIPPKLAAFIGRKHDSMGATEVSEEGENQRKYSTQFEHILDFATWLLRRELQSTIGRNPGQDVHQLPQELIQPYETVESELARVKQEAACDRDAS